MGKWQNQPESQRIEAIRQTIKNHEMPANSYSEKIMNRIGEIDMERARQTKTKGKLLKKVVTATSVAAALGVGIIGTGFVSPVMADTLKHIPLVGNVFKNVEDPGLKVAVAKGLTTSPNLSVTHDGVTLKVKDVFYDGSRIALVFEREGIANDLVMGNITDYTTNELDQSVKGLLGIPVVELPNGEKVKFGSSSASDVIGQPNTVLIELDNVLNTETYGNEFDLNVSVEVAQVNEPFSFTVPVEKVTDDIVKLALNETKSRGNFSYTIKNLELSPATSRLVINSTGEVPSSPEQTGDFSPTGFYYEITDDQGNAFGPKVWGYEKVPAIQHPIVDTSYDPFPQTPQSVTVKPYTYTYDKDFNLVKDSNDEPIKTYYAELEQTIQIP